MQAKGSFNNNYNILAPNGIENHAVGMFFQSSDILTTIAPFLEIMVILPGIAGWINRI